MKKDSGGISSRSHNSDFLSRFDAISLGNRLRTEVGKTTTIAKLDNRDRLEGREPLLIAADTFRAAAAEQLEIWGQRWERR